jgi:hypothetical protein
MKPSKFSKKYCDSLIFRSRIITMMVLAALLLLAQAANASVDVRDFGAVCDGSTDDTAAIQAAIDSSGGGEVCLPVGTYRITSTLNITKGVRIAGESQRRTVLKPDCPNAILINTDEPVDLVRFCVFYPTHQGSGAAITVTGTTANCMSLFSELSFGSAYTGISFVRAAWWRIENCFFGDCMVGTMVQDQYNPDVGDGTITNTTYLIRSGGTAITQTSGGGLRIENSKLLNGDYGYVLQLAAGKTTCDLFIVGCSIEAQRLSGVSLTNQGSGIFFHVIISGCEFELQNVPIQATTSTGKPWLWGMTVTGCTVTLADTGGVAMDIAGTSGAVIVGNSIRSLGGTTYGILMRPSSENSAVANNALVGIGSPLNNLGICNRVAP